MTRQEAKGASVYAPLIHGRSLLSLDRDRLLRRREPLSVPVNPSLGVNNSASAGRRRGSILNQFKPVICQRPHDLAIVEFDIELDANVFVRVFAHLNDGARLRSWEGQPQIGTPFLPPHSVANLEFHDRYASGIWHLPRRF